MHFVPCSRPTLADSSNIAGIGRYLMLTGAYFVNVDVWPSKGISPDLVSFSVCTVARSATTFTFQSGLTLILFTSWASLVDIPPLQVLKDAIHIAITGSWPTSWFRTVCPSSILSPSPEFSKGTSPAQLNPSDMMLGFQPHFSHSWIVLMLCSKVTLWIRWEWAGYVQAHKKWHLAPGTLWPLDTESCFGLTESSILHGNYQFERCNACWWKSIFAAWYTAQIRLSKISQQYVWYTRRMGQPYGSLWTMPWSWAAYL